MTDVFNAIYNEDCMLGLNRIPNGSVDLVVMDPPYETENKQKTLDDMLSV